MQKRREFLKQAGIAGSLLSLAPLSSMATSFTHGSLGLTGIPLSPPSADNDFWAWVQEAYTESPSLINLNNGGVSPQPKTVQEVFEHYNRMCNEAPSYYMWRILDKGRESLRTKLADLAGCNTEEICINRNTTEALGTVVFGINLKKGDEVVLSKYDYPNMMNALKQREKRDGIVLKWVELDMPTENEELIVKKYTEQFTPNTKLVLITHIINWTGQILPVKKIADTAKAKGIEVMVDGAHSFAHLQFRINELNCDYFGSSLHKWLCSPFGSGLLYVRKEKIKNLWPIFPSDNPQSEDIRKFEALGTRSFATEQAISQAIDFHNAIGAKRKEDRLRFLKNYWMEKVKPMKGVKFYTSAKPEFSCALTTIGIEGKDAGELESSLLSKYNIHTTPVKYEKVNGVRITPHVYTKLSDLDRLVNAFKELTNS
ncbi:MAG: aminotransferase class V-fold PLP-dependent enzyme [Flavobacteriales bacterium]|nr:aminotransferase class V-fold PLP-dependent enzyme [Flavobacteriales bacterium]